MSYTELAGLPEGGPATLGGVKAFLAITDAQDDTRLQAVVDAVNGFVRTLPVAELAVNLADWGTAPRVVEGATMLSARVFRRKNSPAGVEAFGDLGPVYVQRNDPDVAMLLGLGAYAPPRVG